MGKLACDPRHPVHALYDLKSLIVPRTESLCVRSNGGWRGLTTTTFADGLTEIGLPQGDVLLALLKFNLCVEIGQLLIAAVALDAPYGLPKLLGHWPHTAKIAMAYGIGIIAAYWFLQRIFA